ncbi:MAG TPA: hypothetical protein DDW76_23170 [Cyanobacteria bacterium UBA11369]|nr:hypothetical protein [Cyanobacteria bacterium UBA11371]HBE33082.1 hypothetical protein [Cyanobacteria bacterium UBA11368]HBE51596.1 hypothetical protein [Cyanobacteria bacterium UBA11369]
MYNCYKIAQKLKNTLIAFGKTVIDYAPDSEQAQHYRNLAIAIDQNTNQVIPTPLKNDDLEKLLVKFGLFD